MKLAVAECILKCPPGWRTEVSTQDGCRTEIVHQHDHDKIIYVVGRLNLISRISYIRDWGYHRDPYDGPALICYHENGNLYTSEYYWHGMLHRLPEEGPAITVYDTSGQIQIKQYFLHGTRVKERIK